MASKGSYPIKIKTINGSFQFIVNRYKTREGLKSWLRLTDRKLDEHHESELLQEFALLYAGKMSYQETSELVRRRSGTSQLSDQRIGNLVGEKAAEITRKQQKMIRENEKRGVKVKAVEAQIYESESVEIVFLADGICVSEQKAKRDKQAKKGKERVTTEMAMLQNKKGEYRTIVAGEGVSRVKLYQAEIVKEYGEKAEEIEVVALTDGARSLKNEIKEVFGEQVSHILDWYHAEDKIRQLMTQIALNKEAKEKANELMIKELWEGRGDQPIKYLAEMKVKNEKKRAELLGYLEKNRNYLIDYRRRKEAGKIIGSGRMEKQNDIIVAKRQKKKGMSWSKKGSRNLALVTAYFPSTIRGINYLQ